VILIAVAGQAGEHLKSNAASKNEDRLPKRTSQAIFGSSAPRGPTRNASGFRAVPPPRLGIVPPDDSDDSKTPDPWPAALPVCEAFDLVGHHARLRVAACNSKKTGAHMGLLDLFKKKPERSDRYAGKPLLRLVDSFVLKCIGELDASSEARLRQMEPKLRQIYQCEGTWEEIIISQLHFSPDIRPAIRDLWLKNQALAKEHKVTLTPMQFVEMFVAKNVTST
jgi:hypothetical protein